MANEITDVDLLLIGKTGNGKSALGNAILKRRAFESRPTFNSVTTEIDYEVADFHGTIIKVVDGPGVGDTRLSTEEATKQIAEAMEKSMLANTRGYHAFLLVVRFGGRFTEEDSVTVQCLKNIFGKNFVRDFCILVMTCGDNFERERREYYPDMNFERWCREHEGVFRELQKECEDRIVLFDNLTRDEAKRDAQITKLLQVVASLQSRGRRYTDENFQRAQDQRERALVESKKPTIREKTFQEISLIIQKLQIVRADLQGDEQIENLQELLRRCDAIIENLQTEDRSTGALKDIQCSVTTTRQSINEAISLHRSIEEEREAAAVRERQMREKMDEEIERQRQQFEELLAQQQRQEEERREMQRELEKQRREQEEKWREERGQREAELLNMLEKERKQLQERTQELERMYKKEKKDQQRGFWGKLIGFFKSLF